MRLQSSRRVLSGLAAGLLAAAALAAPPAAAANQPPTWHASQARVSGAQAPGRDGNGVVVAIIDTWVDPSHPAFGGRVLAGADCVNGCKAGPAAKDICEHGTHVAGTVAASDYGVAPAARILPLRVLAYDPAEKLCTGSSADAADAIRFAVRAGAKVINLSLGGSVPLIAQDPDMVNAVAEAASAGIVVIFAAGNKSYPVTDQYGGNALIIAATDNAGRLPSYSQRGTGVDLAAPGGDAPSGTCTAESCIASLWPNGEYAAMAGTSMSAPHVSGLAALLIAQAPSRGRADVIATMRNTARPLANAGAGLIDMTAALAVRSGKPPAPRPAPTSASPAPRPPAPRPPASQPPATRVGSPKPVVAAPVASSAPLAAPTAAPPVPAAPSAVAVSTPSASATGPTTEPALPEPTELALEGTAESPSRTPAAAAAAGLIAAMLAGIVVVRRGLV